MFVINVETRSLVRVKDVQLWEINITSNVSSVEIVVSLVLVSLVM